MKILAVLLILAALIPQQAGTSVEGEWAVTLTLPLGETWFNMYLAQKGNDLSGYVVNDVGQFEVKGTINRDQIKFQWTFPDGGKLLDIIFNGKVDKNSISGLAKVGNVGEGPLTALRK